VLERFNLGDVDYTSNAHPPTYPDGLDTEVMSFASLEQAWREAGLSSEREHVTAYIWNRPEQFRLANVVNEVDLSHLRWTVDESRDLEFVRRVYACLYAPGHLPFAMNDVLTLLERDGSLLDVNSGIVRNEGYAKSLRADANV
jgi:spore coat polysaccharide biosynthesis protein SpsF